MKRYIPVAGHDSLARDPATGAIVNINKAELEQARQRKAQRSIQKNEINQLKNDVADLKVMIAKLIENQQ